MDSVQSTKEKIVNKEDVTYLSGTEGIPDYALIATVGDVGLGVKVLVETIGPFGFFVGIRLRSANVDSGKPSEASTLLSAWPKLDFQKVNDDRASAVFGTALQIKSAAKLKEVVEVGEFAASTIEFLVETVGNILIDKPLLEEIIESQLREKIDNWPAEPEGVTADAYQDFLHKTEPDEDESVH